MSAGKRVGGVAITQRRAAGKAVQACLLVGLLAVAATPAYAASSKTRIVWSRFGRPNIGQQLVSARPDGSGLRALTHPGRRTDDIDASISPDGRRVAFERDRLDAETSRVVMVGATATTRTRWTSAASTRALPTSPRPGSQPETGSPSPRSSVRSTK